MIPGLSRSKDYGGIRNELESFGDNAAVGFGCFNLIVRIWQFPPTGGAALLLREVPLIDDDDDAFRLFVNLARNVCILCCQAFAGIYDEDSDICPFNGAARTQHAKFFHAGPNTSAPSNTGGINQCELSALKLQIGIDGITGSAWYIGDDRPFVAKYSVEQ